MIRLLHSAALDYAESMTNIDTLTVLVSAEVSTWAANLGLQMHALAGSAGDVALTGLETAVTSSGRYSSRWSDGICIGSASGWADAASQYWLRVSDAGLSVDRDDGYYDSGRWYTMTAESRPVPIPAEIGRQIIEALDLERDHDADGDDDADDDDAEDYA